MFCCRFFRYDWKYCLQNLETKWNPSLGLWWQKTGKYTCWSHMLHYCCIYISVLGILTFVLFIRFDCQRAECSVIVFMHFCGGASLCTFSFFPFLYSWKTFLWQVSFMKFMKICSSSLLVKHTTLQNSAIFPCLRIRRKLCTMVTQHQASYVYYIVCFMI